MEDVRCRKADMEEDMMGCQDSATREDGERIRREGLAA